MSSWLLRFGVAQMVFARLNNAVHAAPDIGRAAICCLLIQTAVLVVVVVAVLVIFTSVGADGAAFWARATPPSAAEIRLACASRAAAPQRSPPHRRVLERIISKYPTERDVQPSVIGVLRHNRT